MGVYRGLLEAHGRLPHEVAEVPLVALLALAGGGAVPHFGAAEQLAVINRRRAEKGLPPVAPRKRD